MNDDTDRIVDWSDGDCKLYNSSVDFISDKINEISDFILTLESEEGDEDSD